MNIELHIKYGTQFGENLAIRINGRKMPMEWEGEGLWKLSFTLPSGDYEYSYFLERDGAVIRSESCSHSLAVRPKTGGTLRRRDWWHDRPASYYASVKTPFGPYGSRAAGVAVPVFALRSEDSFGIGEFTDLKLLVDFAVKSGLKVIQLLPVNDTLRTFGSNESYPYNASSSFALHPQFINLKATGVREDDSYRELRAGLESGRYVDFEAVNRAKDLLLRKAFAERFRKDKIKPGYKKFVSENPWLLPHACFRALCIENHTADFSFWGNMSKYSPAKASRWYAANPEKVDYHIWVQYHLHLQFSAVVGYARSKGVILKGDLPIGVGRHSSDSWANPGLFNMDSSTGAPPDFFGKDGQNWGFPTYNWEAMEADGYKWWKSRLKNMAQYFDAYRIDHVLGFFRIWEIPYRMNAQTGVDVSGMFGHFNPALPYTEDEIKYFDHTGENGEVQRMFLPYPRREGGWVPGISAFDSVVYNSLSEEKKKAFSYLYDDFFYHRHEALWEELGRRKLRALTSGSPMLACGEDLGMIARCVPGVMDEMNILSLEIPRMPKRLGQEFGCPADYPYMSVCTTSSHDMSPMRLWWTTSGEQAGHYYNNLLHRVGVAPSDPDTEVCRDILSNVMNAGSMLCIVPLQDMFACCAPFRVKVEELPDEQINDPADSYRIWRYRMHVTLEKMLSDKEFAGVIYNIVKASMR